MASIDKAEGLLSLTTRIVAEDVVTQNALLVLALALFQRPDADVVGGALIIMRVAFSVSLCAVYLARQTRALKLAAFVTTMVLDALILLKALVTLYGGAGLCDYVVDVFDLTMHCFHDEGASVRTPMATMCFLALIFIMEGGSHLVRADEDVARSAGIQSRAGARLKTVTWDKHAHLKL